MAERPKPKPKPKGKVAKKVEQVKCMLRNGCGDVRCDKGCMRK